MAAPVFAIVAKQNEIRGLISRAVTNVQKLGTKKRTPEQIQTRIETLDANWKKFQSNHETLSLLDPEHRTAVEYFTDETYARCEEEYIDRKSELRAYLNDLRQKVNVDTDDQNASAAKPVAAYRKLPRLDLPKFSGAYREWRRFRDLFSSMVSTKPDISDVEKLHYLQMCLKGDASQLVINIEVTGENFKRAWQALVDRYENKRVLIDTHLASLFSLAKLSQQSAIELKTLLRSVKEALGALETLQCSVEKWDCILVYMVTRKLDSSSLLDWEKQIGNTNSAATFADLEKFILGRIYALEAVARASEPKKPPISTVMKNQTSAKSHQIIVNEPKPASSACILCSAAHFIAACQDFRGKTLEQKLDIVKQKNLCVNCLGVHQFRNCRSTKRCKICNHPHHTLIHRHNESSSDNIAATSSTQQSRPSDSSHGSQAVASALPRRDNSQPSTSASTNLALASPIKYTPVFLATAIVKVTSCYGVQYEVRALLDQGSEVSFISNSLAQRINLPRKNVTLPINGIGTQRSTVSRRLISLAIFSRIDPAISLSVNAYVLAKLTSYLPPIRVLQNPWPHLQDLDLADPDFSSSAQIDLILGAEIYGIILEEGLRKGGLGSPIAQRTSLGWDLSGSVSSEANCHASSRPAQGFQCSVDHELLDLVKRFWVQEEPTATKTSAAMSDEESHCERYFEETHARTLEGRYIVRLPLKESSIDLGNSYSPSVATLIRQERRFATNPSLKESYSKFLAEYEALGHMTCVSDGPLLSQRTFYLPHHAVMRETSSTTKVRVVFNGSFRTNLGVSVNDLQHVGPKLQTNLADVITRWRRYAFVFVADIEKMYRQILIHKEDRDLQRIVWRERLETPPIVYRLNTVTYGLASAGYLAIRTLRQLSIDENHRFPRATDVIQREMYVDDVLSGADDVAEAQDKIHQVDECLKCGGFPLQKWSSNNEELLLNISQSRREQSASVSIEIDPLVRALGLQWQPRSDSFVFTSLASSKSSRVTKRFVLSRVAQLFDPLGWVAPVVVRGKIFIQELWTEKLGWDDSLPDELVTRWIGFERDLEELSQISVPRWLGLRASSPAVELHGFSDASRAALGAVIYLRVLSDLDDVRVTLVAAKTRVAPLKQATIPRLELSAAHLLVRQIAQIKTILDLADVPMHLWTDSTVALAYIRGDARRWADFVRNRVTEIQELPNCHWHHVPGKENPADCASRGLSPRQLKEETLWWNGPTWLSQHSASWPSSIPPIDSEIALEVRKTQANLATKEEPPKLWELIRRFSNLKTLLRVTARIFRAVRRMRRNQATGEPSSPLTPAELEVARLFWVKHMQTAYFKHEIHELSRDNHISRSSSHIRSMPFLDSEGLLRVRGRLRNSVLDHDEKHPLILPRNSPFTALVIDDIHRHTLHGGTQVTLATLRRRYWIVGGRVPVRAFIHRCLQCARYRAELGRQLIGQLPESRATRARPFLNSGVDYAGPLTLRTFRGRGAKTYKGYIVVFVCLSSSAVHLEIATDYSTEGFLAAYKRFTSRRGICETITSDCGTNFVGADGELRSLFQASSSQQTALADILASDGTRWKFNPPSSPHFGGKWKAAVKSVKFHLKRVIGDTGLTYEEYSTLLSQIEAVLNSRPLCPLSDDPADLAALTPGHFLVGSALNTIPEPSIIDLPTSRLSRWQLIRQMLEHFWQRWSTEYLQQLQTTSKWQQRFNSIKIGALVLVKDERYPPSKWALGRVTDVHPGHVGLVRVVTVRTQHSVYKRPIVKLVLLPISTNDDSSE